MLPHQSFLWLNIKVVKYNFMGADRFYAYLGPEVDTVGYVFRRNADLVEFDIGDNRMVTGNSYLVGEYEDTHIIIRNRKDLVGFAEKIKAHLRQLSAEAGGTRYAAPAVHASNGEDSAFGAYNKIVVTLLARFLVAKLKSHSSCKTCKSFVDLSTPYFTKNVTMAEIREHGLAITVCGSIGSADGFYGTLNKIGAAKRLKYL